MPNRAAVMTALNEIRIEDRAIPEPGPHDAVVRIEAVGVCGSDHSYFVRGRIGDYVVNGPLVLGHETSVRFQANFYNAFNKTNLAPIQFGTQNATIENSLFGLSPAADAGRVIDFFLRVDF